MPGTNHSSATAHELTVRIADPVLDNEQLYALFRDARATDFASLDWDAQRLDALLRGQFDAQRSDYDQRFPGSEQRLALLEGTPVALLWVWRSEDQIRLLDFIVAAARRNTGIGTALMLRLQAEAAEASVPLRHMVAVTNTRAIRLYERLGFMTIADAGSHLLMEYPPNATGATGLRVPEDG
ncbi:MAG TPA: GNAT family N-acetyltransferase [Armatimonadota bacterium]|jgi:ribosomal protein S18 acetylase RimI-like enzyme